MIVRIFVATALALVVPSVATAETYYCPFSDFILRLTFNAERKKVVITDPVKTRAVDVEETFQRLSWPGEDKVLAFSERIGDTTFDYELKVVRELDTFVLYSRTVDLNSGKVTKRHGYCLGDP